jgi:hypothetical protein
VLSPVITTRYAPQFAASCGGASLSITKEYIKNQKRPQ